MVCSGLRIIDVSDSSNPTLINTVDTSGTPQGVALSADGNTAYVADNEAGLRIIDLVAVEFSTATDTVSIAVDSSERSLVPSLVIPPAAVQKTTLLSRAHLPLLMLPMATPAPNYTVTAAASNGTASIDASTGAWTYAPTQHFNGSDSFTVTVTDDDGYEETHVISLTVDPANDDPTLDAISDVNINEDASEQTISLTGIAAGGGETQELLVTATSDNTGLIPDPTVTYSSADSTGILAFTPVADQFGTATLTVTVEDGGLDNSLATPGDNGTASQTFTVNVAPGNDRADVAIPFSDQVISGIGPITVSVEGVFEDTTVSGTVVKFETNAPLADNDFYVELTDNTPLTNANFLSYVNSGAYDNSMFHRSVSDFVIQGGGFKHPTVAADQPGGDPVAIPTTGTVQNEPGNLNTRGTIAMAKLGGQPDSATSQFFFNLGTNSFLDSDNGGYTQFGSVLGSGMTVIDTIGSGVHL